MNSGNVDRTNPGDVGLGEINANNINLGQINRGGVKSTNIMLKM